MTETIIPQFPDFFELLNSQDKKQYLYMKMTLSSSVCKNRRNQSDKTFEQILEMIKVFCIRNNDEDWKRCLVCGLFWLDDNQIAVNSKQLCVLLSKCKSSINGSLQNLHYLKVRNNRNSVKNFIVSIPLYAAHPDLLVIRQWTMRKHMPSERSNDNKATKSNESPVSAHEETNDLFDHFSDQKQIPHFDHDFFCNDFLNFDPHNYFYFPHDILKDEDLKGENDTLHEHHLV